MEKITYNFSEQEGYIKPLHGVNNAPYAVLNEELSTEFMKGAGIPFSRLHDAMGPYGGSHYVDVPNIFPDFDADAADPSNYDFTLTDYYIGSIVKAGTEIFYRLGITIDWAKKSTGPFRQRIICNGRKSAKVSCGIITKAGQTVFIIIYVTGKYGMSRKIRQCGRAARKNFLNFTVLLQNT